ncbi:hypothetical protein SDRG_07573 [Saprolegnia diclina VS20]|uniref:Uncharacterized protein n=1 Tax=Saprolegnia diclina (strain VS20) TaxID=1156394 RepID=T0QLS3_SAPDV|nr:hypothetical protein SDRG_07573 [Saprolegnia diclina VS20]EQC34765.1 hypothetical protein SDRG_07573 [Saprolegnia diclina VS20]|eukprot:XP_008611637.1 hypothetical protein SDRG_07573 [Saprolegnia diclina VS20]
MYIDYIRVWQDTSTGSKMSYGAHHSGKDLHADLSLIDGKGPLHWGINYKGTCFPIANGYKGGFLCDRDSQNPKCDEPRQDWQAPTAMMEPFEYQMDAISANWDVSYEAYTTFYKYQLEWYDEIAVTPAAKCNVTHRGD